MNELREQFSEAIKQAIARRRPVRIRGSGSKDFYGGAPKGEVIDTTRYTGIVDYAPEELVLTARAGTPLAEIEAALAAQGQMLPFEPPHFGPRATLGGCVAAGLSGPRRASLGAVRDFVLGVHMMDGKADALRFGGQVMKNVAGYDVSRLMAGSMGTLGLILEVSLKVLPRPKAEATVQFECDEAQALQKMNRWAGEPLPISATCYHDHVLTLRLSGAQTAVQAAQAKLGGQALAAGEEFWRGIREQSANFFRGSAPLWRLPVPSTAALDLPGKLLIEWGGALRWVFTEAEAGAVRAAAEQVHGQGILFRGATKPQPVFHPLPKPLMDVHRRMKHAFDPHGIFNLGRMYPDF
ncbi:MAG: glycolate oxidase subunit GlcE [Hydrogenophilales bacterium]|nr:glycolate oxidase subunit GlcE [Hydrogenophilales bacterium]